MKNSRYIKTQIKNVRLDTHNGKYESYKTINGKRYSSYHLRISDAKKWLREFSPDHVSIATSNEYYLDWMNKYLSTHVNLKHSAATKEKTVLILNTFNPYFSSKSLGEITPFMVSEVLTDLKSKASERRLSFKKELKTLKTFFNWVADRKQDSFVNPVRRYHFQDCIVRKNTPKKRKLTIKELQNFFNSFDSPLFKDMALTQFLTGCRISEIAGLQKESIDLENRTLVIKDVVEWSSNKSVLGLKPTTKNGDIKEVCISCTILEDIIRKYLNQEFNGSYMFSENGKALGYRKIQYQFKKAIKKAELDVTGATHFLRHSMANLSRTLGGSIDAAQAITGHKSVKQAEHYTGSPTTLQAETLKLVSNKVFG